jgi:PAS domain S-box-containing protein
MDTLGIPLEDLFTSVVDALSVGISIHSTSGEIVWANKKLCDIYRQPLSKLKGSDCQEVFHGENSPCPHEQVLATGSGVHLESEVTIAGRILSLTVKPLFDEGGRTRGFIRMLSDITGERRAHEQVIKAERFATLGQIFSGIAHDVGTPLNVISGYSEYLLMRTMPEGQGSKELSAILQQTRRIAAMFGEALDLGRPSQGRKDPIEIKPLLMGALDLVGHSLRKGDVKVELTCGIEPPLIYGEAPQLRQALFNLLLNAGQLVGTGGSLEVVIEEAPEKPGFLALAFWGTDAAGASHDFSRSLGCLPGAQIDGGTVGIGLSLAQEILNAAGAIISSGPGCERGIPLMVYLPVNAGSRA